MAHTVPVQLAALGQNQLLAGLSDETRAGLIARLEPVQLGRGEVLAAAGAPHAHVYFPTTCLVSVVVSAGGSGPAEFAIVGREGFIGLPVVLGTDPAWQDAICQVPGGALRMATGPFLSTLRRTAELRQVLHRYAGVRLDEAGQLVRCNARHVVRQRLARWLLTTQDRLGADRFDLTQDEMARMLAVRRPFLTQTAQDLQRMGCISYRRGHVVVRDRALLESTACDDYGAVRAQFARLVPA